MRRLLCVMLLMLCPMTAQAQGAVIETLDTLRDAADPPSFRGTLPTLIDLSATLPPPRSQGGTQSCVSWATTYGAASQALPRQEW